MLQSIICPNTISFNEFKRWLFIHSYIPIKPIHITAKYYHARLANPIKNHRYYSKILPNGLIMIFEE